MVPTGRKYTDSQLVHLMSFCGLQSSEKVLLPGIWTKIQNTKDWYGASAELNKWFWVHQTAGLMPFQFHNELVDDIRKLIFSLGSAPLVDNAHRGISLLGFGSMTVAEENQLREDQEYRDGATSLTPANIRAAKRKCPSIPVLYDPFDRLISRYICAGQLLFTRRCHHSQEVTRMKEELLLIYSRNGGHLAQGTIAGLCWDIIADSAQFFNTFSTEEEFRRSPNRAYLSPIWQYDVACCRSTCTSILPHSVGSLLYMLHQVGRLD